MKKALKFLSAATLAVAASSASALAIPSVNIGGLETPLNAHIEVASIYENIIFGVGPDAVGQTLSGVGEVSQMNGFNVSSLCAGCELTYAFTGFTVTSATASAITFSGGVITFYLDFGGTDFNPFVNPNSAAAIAAASDGVVFLTLAGHAVNAAGDTFVGSGTNIGSSAAAGSGFGLADVVLGAGFGIAQSNFNTNTIPALFPSAGFADVQLGSSFGNAVVPYASECPTGPMCLAGSADFRGFVIPEPSTTALVGLALLGLGLSTRRRAG